MILGKWFNMINRRKKKDVVGFCIICGKSIDELDKTKVCDDCSFVLYGLDSLEDFFEDPHYNMEVSQ